MHDDDYSPEQLAQRYQISIQQARRYITRFGSTRSEMDRLLSASSRTNEHIALEMSRTAAEIAIG